MIELISESDAIVAHGGAGVFNMCASLGKMPILVPRLVKLGEHRDTSQPFFCERLEDLNLCLYLKELSSPRLIDAINYVHKRSIIFDDEEYALNLMSAVSAQLNEWGFDV